MSEKEPKGMLDRNDAGIVIIPKNITEEDKKKMLDEFLLSLIDDPDQKRILELIIQKKSPREIMDICLKEEDEENKK